MWKRPVLYPPLYPLAVTALLACSVLIMALPTLPTSGNPLAQVNPTEQRQTLDAVVGQRFTQTAVQAATITAQFETAVYEVLNEALTATALSASNVPAEAASPTAALAPSTEMPATAAPDAAKSATAPRNGAQPTTYSLGSADELGLPQLGQTYLSWDGQKIAFVEMRQICIYSVLGVKELCTLVDTPLDRNSVRWSPNNRLLTFTEDFFRSQKYDPDIWTLDATSGKLTDLTDDGTKEFHAEGDNARKNGNIDVAPAWTSDGGQILFVRYGDKARYGPNAGLYMIDAKGGNPLRVGTLNTVAYHTYALAVSPDTRMVAFNALAEDRFRPVNGLWVSTTEGTGLRHLLKPPATAGSDAGTPDPQLAAQVIIPSNLQFSADGRSLLTFDPTGLGGVSGSFSRSTSRIVAVDGSGDTPVDGDERALWATWSPKGTAIAYIIRDSKRPELSGLYVMPKPGSPGQLIYPGNVYAPVDVWRTLTWSTDNSILVAKVSAQKRVVVLIHLNAK